MTRIWNKTSVEKFIDNIREEQFKNIASTIGNDKLIFPWKKKKERKRKEGGWKTELLNARHKGRKYWCAHVLLLRFRPSSTSILRFPFFFFFIFFFFFQKKLISRRAWFPPWWTAEDFIPGTVNLRGTWRAWHDDLPLPAIVLEILFVNNHGPDER